MKLGLAPLVLAAVLPSLGIAAEDARGSKDHPLLTRYPNSHIVEYEKNFNAAEFAIGTKAGEPERKPVEGDATVILYFHNDADKQPSALQVIRNYQNAIKSIGGQVVYERLPRENDGGETTLKVATEGKEVWVRVEPGSQRAHAELQAVGGRGRGDRQVVSANKLLEA